MDLESLSFVEHFWELRKCIET